MRSSSVSDSRPATHTQIPERANRSHDAAKDKHLARAVQVIRVHVETRGGEGRADSEMASNDKAPILLADETDQRWRKARDESINSHSLEQEAGPSAPAPGLEGTSDSQASTSPSQLSMGCMERICLRINQHLLISKIFYFFFYSAYGSLHPLLPVYYKQLGLSASQSGLLVGIRYFIEFCSAPFWGVFADRFRKGKVVLLFSVLCWLMFNCGIGFVKPADISCVDQSPEMGPQNSTQLNASVFHSRNSAENFFVTPQYDSDATDYRLQAQYSRNIGASPTETPATLDNATRPSTSTPTTLSTTVTPPQYKTSYNKEQVDKIFLLILLVIIIGEFFSAPAVTIVDTVTLHYLGRQRDHYGLQRMWGSLGWGVAMLSVGIWIDHTHIQPNIHSAGCSNIEFKDYRIAFIVFGVLMGVALLVATQFYFDSNIDHNVDQVNREQAQTVQSGNSSIPIRSAAEITLPPGHSQQEFRFGDLIKVLCSIQCSTVLFVAWFMGFGYGFIFSFLYWYLQTLNGTTTLFGICSVLSHVSELVAYFTSYKLIELVGHIRVLYIGLACNTGRYLYISYLQNAWVVLPMEVLQGLTHASVWAACISYLGATVPPALRTSAQGTLQGLHLGLGRGCGAMLGGVFISYFGEAATFRILGMASLVILIIFFFIQWLTRQGDSDEDILADNVPNQSNPVPIATIDVSSQQPPMKTRLQQEQEDANKPAWVLSASPWVNVAFAFCQIQEVIKRTKRNPPADTLSPQGTNEMASSEPPTEETPHSQPAEQSGDSEQQTPTDQATGQPNKEPAGQADRPAGPRSPSAMSHAAQDPAVENQTTLPGNFDTFQKKVPK